MKSSELLEVIGEAQDDYILDAKTAKKKHTPAWVKWAAMAACLCLIVAGAWRLGIAFLGNNMEDPFREGQLYEMSSLDDLPLIYPAGGYPDWYKTLSGLKSLDLENATFELYYAEGGDPSNVEDWYRLLINTYDDPELMIVCVFNGRRTLEEQKVDMVFTKDNTETIEINGTTIQIAPNHSLEYDYWHYSIFEYGNVVFDVRCQSNDEDMIYTVLGQILRNNSNTQQRPIAAYIQKDVNQVIVTHSDCETYQVWTEYGEDLDALRDWANNLGYDILPDEDKPENLNGSEKYRISISEGDYPGFTYIIDGDKHYLEIEGYWYTVTNPSYPPVIYDSADMVAPGNWPDDVDAITASIAVFPDTEDLQNVARATLTDIDEQTAYSFEKLGAYLPTYIKEGYRFAKASLYETTMKDGTKYYQLRVTFADGDITEAAPTTNPETGEQSKDAPLTTANTYMIFIMNYLPGEEYTIYSGDALTEYIRELPSNGVFHFSLDDVYVGFVPYDLTSEDVQAVVNSMK
ncbi:MAG: hypothetical protein IKW46_02840 [Bacteroidaceae bacterium]|nr:hypothetical protein [Bacteroidaceae bacterium]